MLHQLEEERQKLQLTGYLKKESIAQCEPGALLIEGRRYLDFTSWDALNQAVSKRVTRKLQQSAKVLGITGKGQRFEGGYHRAHHLLEQRLAQFIGAECGLLMPGVRQIVMTVITSLCNERDLVLYDATLAGPVEDACYLVDCRVEPFHASNVSSLLTLLQQAEQYRRILIFTESISGLTGEITPLQNLLSAARSHNALLVLDESTSLGLIGQRGAGVRDIFPLEQEHLYMPGVLQYADLSRAMGTFGSFLAGTSLVLDVIKARSRVVREDALFPSCLASAVIASLDEVEGKLLERQLLLEKANRLQAGFEELGLPVVRQSIAPFASLVFSSQKVAQQFVLAMRQQGVWVAAVGTGVRRKGMAIVRFIPNNAHSNGDISEALQAAEGIKKRLSRASGQSVGRQ